VSLAASSTGLIKDEQFLGAALDHAMLVVRDSVEAAIHLRTDPFQ
jgi:hypothetical protein